MHPRLAVLFSAAAVHLFAASANAQYVLERFSGLPVSNNDSFGWACAMAGDVDGDGWADPMAGAPNGPTPYARLFSGRTGAPLYHYTGSWDSLGRSMGNAGDVDLDGRDDFFISAMYERNAQDQQRGAVHIYSGATGLLIRKDWGQWQGDNFGTSVANLGDLNGDGVAELAVSATDSDVVANNAGYVRVLSGIDGSVRFTLFGSAANEAMGFSLAACGDFNQDGITDFLVGTPLAKVSGIERGVVRVHSGADGAVLLQLQGANYQDMFGIQVANAGDVNGDGRADFVIGAQQETLGFQRTGTAAVFSGLNGSLIFKRGGGSMDANHWHVAGGFDFDNDGLSDIAVGAPTEIANTGAVRVYRGYDGALLLQVIGTGDQLGASVASAGDYDRNGRADLLVGAPMGPREVRVYSGDLCYAERVCTARPNSVGAGAWMTHSGSSSLVANTLVLEAQALPANVTCVPFFGSAFLAVPYFDGIRCASGQVFRLPVATSDANGRVSVFVDRVNGPSSLQALAPGSAWHCQFVYRDPGFGLWGVNTTDSLKIGFCP
jgi:hypothetical protein